jgi:glycosyltransferase involved in cell wall biosynthesis
MSERPFASIIVPVYNGSHTIGELLDSLVSQTYPRERYEIIVIDNNSQDGTPERVQPYPVRLLYEREQQNSYAARNRGIQAARGEAIVFTDAACVAHPDWLCRLLADFSDPRWVGFAGSFEPYKPLTSVQKHMAAVRAHCLDPSFSVQPFLAAQSRGERLCSRLPFLDYRAALTLPPGLINAPTGNVAYRRQVFDDVGDFDVRFTSCGDLDLAWRVQTQTKKGLKLVSEAIIYYKYRPDLSSMARQFRKNGWGYGLLALKYSPDPHRAARQIKFESVILIGLATASHGCTWGMRLLRRLLGRPADALYLTDPLFTLVRSVNFYYGRLTAARKGNQTLRSKAHHE